MQKKLDPKDVEEAKRRASRDRIIVLHAEYLQKPPTRKKAQAAREAAESALRTIAECEHRIRDVRKHLPKLAESLIATHGDGPIELDGTVYDFGCYNGVVHLRPRAQRKR